MIGFFNLYENLHRPGRRSSENIRKRAARKAAFFIRTVGVGSRIGSGDPHGAATARLDSFRANIAWRER